MSSAYFYGDFGSNLKFCGYKLSRSWKLLTKFSHFYSNFDHFSVFLINISRVISRVRYRGYKISRVELKIRFHVSKLSRSTKQNRKSAKVFTFKVIKKPTIINRKKISLKLFDKFRVTQDLLNISFEEMLKNKCVG